MKTVYGLLGVVTIVTGMVSPLMIASPAKASLEFCNKSNKGTVSITVAYPDGKGSWTTEGWFNLEPGECDNAIEGDLTNRYYYYFAETESDYSWEGDNQFCVSDKKFTFTNAEKQCKGSNSRWANFRELDTGKDTTSYSLDLR